MWGPSPENCSRACRAPRHSQSFSFYPGCSSRSKYWSTFSFLCSKKQNQGHFIDRDHGFRDWLEGRRAIFEWERSRGARKGLEVRLSTVEKKKEEGKKKSEVSSEGNRVRVSARVCVSQGISWVNHMSMNGRFEDLQQRTPLSKHETFPFSKFFIRSRR